MPKNFDKNMQCVRVRACVYSQEKYLYNKYLYS